MSFFRRLGDNFWNSIINSSRRTNQKIDELLGIQNPYNSRGLNHD